MTRRHVWRIVWWYCLFCFLVKPAFAQTIEIASYTVQVWKGTIVNPDLTVAPFRETGPLILGPNLGMVQCGLPVLPASPTTMTYNPSAVGWPDPFDPTKSCAVTLRTWLTNLPADVYVVSIISTDTSTPPITTVRSPPSNVFTILKGMATTGVQVR